MAASTSTTVTQDYDVFMSLQGEDTRMGFTSHLYEALVRNDIRTYKDDKTLEIGNPIASELLAAIEGSRTAIVVLSNNFATSKWCLEEIAKIIDCKEHAKLIVIPVFYHMDPSDIMERWRDAFRKVGALSGLHVTQHRS
ncbi:NB-ARC domains-containing protein [Tanacetum coccineum]